MVISLKTGKIHPKKGQRRAVSVKKETRQKSKAKIGLLHEGSSVKD